MKNEHLVPVNIVDLVSKLQDKTLRENEVANYQLRLEAIKEYCSIALHKHLSQKPVTKTNTRVIR